MGIGATTFAESLVQLHQIARFVALYHEEPRDICQDRHVTGNVFPGMLAASLGRTEEIMSRGRFDLSLKTLAAPTTKTTLCHHQEGMAMLLQPGDVDRPMRVVPFDGDIVLNLFSFHACPHC